MLGEDATAFRRRIEFDGWDVPRAMVEGSLLDEIGTEVAIAEAERRGGVRDPLAISVGVRHLARHASVRRTAEAVLGPECFVARALFFDKTERANWKVAWHQDLTITVLRRIETPGFGPWSVKAGITHMQPPVAVLERMLAVRVHLDDCHAANGPVRVLPGSHLCGQLTQDEIDAWKQQHVAVECLATRGAIIAFRPLLLHASSPALAPGRRRVVHFEFAVGELPGELQWHRRE